MDGNPFAAVRINLDQVRDAPVAVVQNTLFAHVPALCATGPYNPDDCGHKGLCLIKATEKSVKACQQGLGYFGFDIGGAEGMGADRSFDRSIDCEGLGDNRVLSLDPGYLRIL
jgi:hypothetical protein